MALGFGTTGTAWERGRFDSRPRPRTLLFGIVYEDAQVEVDALPANGRVFCIASGGCTAFRLSRRQQIVAVDINPAQVAYVKRRLRGGPLESGSADHMLGLARCFAPLVGWNQARMREFLNLEDPRDQISYWRQHLNTRRFRTGLRLMLSRPMLRMVYSTQLVNCLPPNFGEVVQNRMERCFSLHTNRRNPYAHALLLGETDLTKNIFDDANITLVCSDAATYLEHQSAGSFTGFTLSNILDGASRSYAERLFNAVQHAAAPGAVVVIRSFREPSEHTRNNRSAKDRAMLWGIVEVRPASKLDVSMLGL